jgi:hypothetical protein
MKLGIEDQKKDEDYKIIFAWKVWRVYLKENHITKWWIFKIIKIIKNRKRKDFKSFETGSWNKPNVDSDFRMEDYESQDRLWKANFGRWGKDWVKIQILFHERDSKLKDICKELKIEANIVTKHGIKRNANGL